MARNPQVNLRCDRGIYTTFIAAVATTYKIDEQVARRRLGEPIQALMLDFAESTPAQRLALLKRLKLFQVERLAPRPENAARELDGAGRRTLQARADKPPKRRSKSG